MSSGRNTKVKRFEWRRPARASLQAAWAHSQARCSSRIGRSIIRTEDSRSAPCGDAREVLRTVNADSMCARINPSTLHFHFCTSPGGRMDRAPSRSRSSQLSSPARSSSADVHQRVVGQYLAACSAVLSLVDSCRPERFRVRRCARPCWVRGGSRFSSRPLPALVRRSRPIALRALRRRTCTPVTGRKRGACPGTSAPTTLSLRDELGSSRRIRPVRGRSGFAARLLRVLFSPSHKPEATARTVRRRHSPGPVRGLNAASSGSASAGRNVLSRPGPRGGCTSAGKGCPGHRTRL